MDIKNFYYFVTIVEEGLNLSTAARKIHISQSTLSKAVTTFEKQEGIKLFNRHNGRLVSLTAAGEKVYAAGKNILSIYTELMDEISKEAAKFKDKVVVGIPPLVITVVFTEMISNFFVQFPNIELDIVEAGAEELRQKFINKEIDFAVLLSPTNLADANSREHTIYIDELMAFVSNTSSLSGRKIITWSDLDRRRIAIFNETFTINRLLIERFKETKIEPVIAIKSGSWDFLLESVHNHDIITILPAPIKNYVFNSENYTKIPFADPINWKVVMVEHTDKKLTTAQNFFKQYLLDASARNR